MDADEETAGALYAACVALSSHALPEAEAE